MTTYPTAEWIVQQITEAFPWNEAPRYLIRDRDGMRHHRGRTVLLNEIGSIRRECVDHVVALGEQHLRRVVRSYARYYNEARTHRSLNKDAPITRPVQRTGHIASHALVGGLHHQYVRKFEFSVHTGIGGPRTEGRR